MRSTRFVILVVAAIVLMLCAHEALSASKCPTVCTFEYNPSCGRKADGTTHEFANPCLQRTYDCEKGLTEFTSITKGKC